MKRVIIISALSMSLVGCSRQAMPNYINGDYYMAGDDQCRSYMALPPGQIMCRDADGMTTEIRNAMTNGDMQMYQNQQITQQMQMAQLNQQLHQTGQSFQNAGQQIQNQNQSYLAPQVQSYSTGSNPVLYNRVGSSVVGTDGSACHYVGSGYICQ